MTVASGLELVLRIAMVGAPLWVAALSGRRLLLSQSSNAVFYAGTFVISALVAVATLVGLVASQPLTLSGGALALLPVPLWMAVRAICDERTRAGFGDRDQQRPSPAAALWQRITERFGIFGHRPEPVFRSHAKPTAPQSGDAPLILDDPVPAAPPPDPAAPLESFVQTRKIIPKSANGHLAHPQSSGIEPRLHSPSNGGTTAE